MLDVRPYGGHLLVALTKSQELLARSALTLTTVTKTTVKKMSMIIHSRNSYRRCKNKQAKSVNDGIRTMPLFREFTI